MDTITQKVIVALESVKDTLEKKDQDLLERKQYFGSNVKQDKVKDQKAVQDDSSQLEKMKGAQVEIVKQESQNGNLGDFQQVGYELLDIGIHYGCKTVDHVKSLPVYQKIDAYVDFEDKFAIVLKHSQTLYTYVDSTFRPIVEKVFFLYNSTTQTVTTFINLMSEKQEQIVEYVTKTYSMVNVTVSANWLRLDFDKDSSVTVMDLKKSMLGLYAFLKDFDVFEEASIVKCQLYTKAIHYMKSELELNEQKRKRQIQSSSVDVDHAVFDESDKMEQKAKNE